MHRRARDLKGMKQNYLTAIEYVGSNGKKSLWKVRCDCGKEFIMTAGHFLEGKQKSCGCMRGKLIEAAKGTHRHSKHPLYHVWRSMKQRCTVPTAQAWANYGGRGIRVCDRWLESFENFWADMSPTYQEGLTLDRIDVNGNYTPENCRWVDYKTQARNTRKNILINTPWGRITVAEASERSGIGNTTLLYRLDHGWTEDILFTKPDLSNKSTTLKMQAQITASQLKPKQDQ